MQDVPSSKEIKFLTEKVTINECSGQDLDGFLKTNAFLILENGLRAASIAGKRASMSGVPSPIMLRRCKVDPLGIRRLTNAAMRRNFVLELKRFCKQVKSRQKAIPLFCFLFFFWLC